jgi:hypothetical protein
MTKTSDDPWRDLTPPDTTSTLAGRRVSDEPGPAAFYWLLDRNRSRILGLKHASACVPKDQMPKIQGLHLEDVADDDANGTLLVRLVDAAQVDLFYRLCTDIIDSASGATSPQASVSAVLHRTWRWHHLLRGGTDGRMTPHVQQGLIGELRVLETELAPRMPISEAVEAWTGPFGSPRDFEIGASAIEAKARRGGAEPFITISSEHQLDATDVERLLLHVINLNRPAPDTEGFCVTDVVERIRDMIERENPAVLDAFEARLLAVGYRPEDDYADSLWTETDRRLYDVREHFPRIEAHELRSGVSGVSYRISMVECVDFEVSSAEIDSLMGGTR